jgi:hypothetical protein
MPVDAITPPTAVELLEANRLLGNLVQFIVDRPGNVELSPVIPGCGIVDRSSADILIEAMTPFEDLPTLLLYEVKVVDRGFRAIDFRQLLTYAALMLAERRLPRLIGLVNPRRGVYFECDLNALCMDTAGVPAGDLLDRIIFEITSGEVSL